MSDHDLINEFKRRNLVNNQTLDKLLVDHKITQLKEQIQKSEAEIAALVAQKIAGQK